MHRRYCTTLMAINLAIAAVAAVAVAGSIAAHDYRLQTLHIDHPFARATPPGARFGGVFSSIANRGDQTDPLLRVSTPVAPAAELHQMVVDAGVMRMRPIAGLDVKPGGRLVLQPGGYHVMDLKRPLQTGGVGVEVEGMAAGAMHPNAVP